MKEHMSSAPVCVYVYVLCREAGKQTEIKQVYEENRGIKTGGYRGKEQGKKGKSRKRGGERKYCLPRCALYPPFTTSLLFVQMPNSLLCETQGFQVNADTGLVFSERLQLQSTLSEEHRLDYMHLLLYYIHRKRVTFSTLYF